jgi:hypothetical protein
MTKTLSERIEIDIMSYRLKKIDYNGDFYFDDKEEGFEKEVDENDEHHLLGMELV